jgi:hypothetical protein
VFDYLLYSWTMSCMLPLYVVCLDYELYDLTIFSLNVLDCFMFVVPVFTFNCILVLLTSGITFLYWS